MAFDDEAYHGQHKEVQQIVEEMEERNKFEWRNRRKIFVNN